MRQDLRGSAARSQEEEKMNSDLSKVKVGDFIWTIKSGWTKIVEINKVFHYPIITEDKCGYTLQGFFRYNDQYPSAFTEPPACFNAEPKPCEFKKGDRVLVTNKADERTAKRYFSHMYNDLYACFIDGNDEWSSDGLTGYWEYCKPWVEGEDE